MKPLITIIIALCISYTATSNNYNIYYNANSESLEIGLKKLQKSFQHKSLAMQIANNPANANILLFNNISAARGFGIECKDLGHEAFSIKHHKNKIAIIGGDDIGLLYGIFQLAEHITFNNNIESIPETNLEPRFEFRAIKFNLPFMAYRSDHSTAQHLATCRNIEFWEQFLDMMVENRFNVLSLWSLHLYHYMVIPENFPEATHFSYHEMQDWKKFWGQLFHQAKIRGIDTYVINWNTFVSPSFAAAHNVAEYSMRPWHYGPGDTTKIVEQYTRQVIEQVINEYPDLTGLGITLGERMGGQEPSDRRIWLDSTFFAAMGNANRKIKFVYRAPLSANANSAGSTSEENDLATRKQIEALETEGPVWVEFKYNWSHGHSSPNLFIVHGGKLTDIYRTPVPDKYKYIWTVRNEDFHVNRWGQSDFIRQFIANNGHNYVGGCFIGSEGYIPAKDVFTRPGKHKTWAYAFERQWLFYALWGRLLYNPNTSNKVFANMLEQRYGNGLGEKALEAFNTVSKVPLMFASFRQGRNDLSLYTEGFTAWSEFKDMHFFTLDKFIGRQVLDTIRYININDYITNGEQVAEGMLSPFDLADSLETIANKGMELYNTLSTQIKNPAALAEIQDIESWCWFAKYFATKLRAGVYYAIADINGENTYPKALEYLEQGIGYWTNYANSITKYNNDSFLFHTKEDFSWHGMLDFVKQDAEMVKNKLTGK